ncbi:hypothetical protein GQ44DRAFT_777396 [Phaeosphaeriaceae sp. PMI808]|nr:hypothetical protein GQ44DRAFT_777396 [Phaeosphaeriaceae sp. PMI808]
MLLNWDVSNVLLVSTNRKYDYGTDGPDSVMLHGDTAMFKVLKRLKRKGERCNIVVLLSFHDLSQLIEKHADLVRETVSAFYFQGAWEEYPCCPQLRTLVPDMTITNNMLDPEATLHVHDWLRRESIPTFTATRHSASKATVNLAALAKLARRGYLGAGYICRAWNGQEIRLFDQAAEKDPQKRCRPRMDLQWYVDRYPRW